MQSQFWGGIRGAIVTCTADGQIAPRWHATLRSVDPDAILVHRAIASRRQLSLMRSQLDRLGLAPLWIEPLRNSALLTAPWKPAAAASGTPVAVDESDDSNVNWKRDSKSLLRTAQFGLPATEWHIPALPRPRFSTASRLTNLSFAVVPDTPAGRGALGVQGFRQGVSWLDPFLVYGSDSVDAALWLWNLRAAQGNFLHGTEQAALAYLNRPPFASRPLTFLYVGSAVPEQLKVAMDALPDERQGRLRSAADHQPWMRAVQSVSDREEIPVTEGSIEIPRRNPESIVALGTPGFAVTEGAYAVDYSIEPPDSRGRLICFPSRHAMADGLTHRQQRPRPQTMHTRILREGLPTALISSQASRRTIRLVVPTMATTLATLDRTTDYKLSDKGRFARWMTAHIGGLQPLQELLVDPRSRALLEAFRSHHREGEDVRGSYRRFMSIAEMRAEFRKQRHVGALPKRIKGSAPDDEWLTEWVTRLVESGVLRLGVFARCHDCLAGSFVPLAALATTFDCPRCGLSVKTPGLPRLGYQLAEVAHQFLANDGDVTALAVAAMGRRSLASFSYDFDHELVGMGGATKEIDFAVVLEGGLFIGESKKSGRFDRADFETLKLASKRLKARGIVLATDRGCEGGCRDLCQRDWFDSTGSSDLALTAGIDGPRDRVEKMRAELSEVNCSVVVLCQRELRGS